MKKLFYILPIAILLLTPVACTHYDYDQADTPANQAGFERHFGFSPPDSVAGLYYYADEMGADVLYQMGFVASPETIESIVAEVDLVQHETDFHSSLARDFDWWDKNVIDGLTPYWKTNADQDHYWLLWYAPDSQRAYYLEFSL